MEKIKIDDKYEIEIGGIPYENVKLYSVEVGGTPYVTAKRYGEIWRDCTGDGLIMAMAYRIQELEEKAWMYDDLNK